MKIVKIDVTAEDIASGVSGDCQHCPIAIAMTRALGVGIYVGTEDWCVKSDEAKHLGLFFHRWPLPVKVVGFVDVFDNYPLIAAKPFSFEIEVADDILKPVLPT